MKTNYFKHLLTTVALMAAVSAKAEVYSGTCGKELTWTMNTMTGLLLITGTGEMYNYPRNNLSSVPWFGYRNYIRHLVIAEGVTSIGHSAFSYCTNLNPITIPETMTSIGDYTFYDCTGLESVNIPKSVISIGICAFENCYGLTTIIFPSNMTSISDYMCIGCTGLTDIYIPENVTTIGHNAFGNCNGLTSISIPSSVTNIGYYAFSGCDNIRVVNVLGAIPPTMEDTNAFNNSTSDIILHFWHKRKLSCKSRRKCVIIIV